MIAEEEQNRFSLKLINYNIFLKSLLTYLLYSFISLQIQNIELYISIMFLFFLLQRMLKNTNKMTMFQRLRAF